jgi:hypothetical protein
VNKIWHSYFRHCDRLPQLTQVFSVWSPALDQSSVRVNFGWPPSAQWFLVLGPTWLLAILCYLTTPGVLQPDWLTTKLLSALVSTVILGSESHETYDHIYTVWRLWEPSLLTPVRSQRPTVSEPVCLGVEPSLRLMTKYTRKLVLVMVLSMWGAFSDERAGLSFVRVIVRNNK